MHLLHDTVTDQILRAAVAVHTGLGPGLAEHSYQAAMAIEMTVLGLTFEREPTLPVRYRGAIVGQHRPDFIVEHAVVLELKSVSSLDSVFTSQGADLPSRERSPSRSADQF